MIPWVVMAHHWLKMTTWKWLHRSSLDPMEIVSPVWTYWIHLTLNSVP